MQSMHAQDCYVSYMDTQDGTGSIPTHGDLNLAGNFVWTRANSETVRLKDLNGVELDRLEHFVARELKKRRFKMIACVHYMHDDKSQEHADAVSFLLEARDAIETERMRRFHVHLETKDEII